MTSYKTIGGEASTQFVEKHSRFIGYVAPVESEQQALDFIEKIKGDHWDAKHNVYAYSIKQGNRQRYSDDSEPKGTAGLPILDVINKECLNNIIVVVTRYFGGILLGKGGLVRAYSSAAKLAIGKAGIISMSFCKLCTVTAAYNLYGKITSVISSNSGFIDSTEYTDKVAISFHIQEHYLESLTVKLKDATADNFNLQNTGEMFLKTE